MSVRAHHRILRTRYAVMAAVTVAILAVVLWIKLGSAASAAVLQAFGIVSLAILIGAYIFEKVLWKSWIGKLVGCPPDYSGNWEGEVHRIIKTRTDDEDVVRIKVTIKQNLLDVEWHQIGYGKDGNIIAESHLLFGEVIDNQRPWGSICGMYEVTRKNNEYTKHYGSFLADISQDELSIDGSYCSTAGNVGNIKLKKV